MRKTIAGRAVAHSLGAFGVASLALFLAQTPAHAGGDVTNFKVKNCASERIFVCSFDKTDSLMNIPYKAAGIQPGDKKQFGCASIGRCKVIIGVSREKSKHTLSKGMQTALAAGSGAMSVAAVGGIGTGLYLAGFIGAGAGPVVLAGAGVGAAMVAVTAGGAVAALEIKDGWSDGDVCNQVRRAAKKAGYTPKDSMQDGKTYVVSQQYAVNKQGRAYVNADGTAMFAYKAKKGNSCPAALKAQLVPN